MHVNNDRPVCVLGFGRSGTSLTIRLLNLMGVDIGPVEDLVPPTEAENPRGYWEPAWMLEINDEILAKLGTDWWHPLLAEPGWEHGSEFEPLRERARGLLADKFGSVPLWGWKEPRTTLTLPFWRDLIPNARYVICMRSPTDAISSLQRRPEPNLSIRAWGDLWLEYTARALNETRGQSRLIIFYEDLLLYSSEEIARMASFLDLEPTDISGIDSRLIQEIDHNLRHHSTSALELAVAWGIPPAARMLFLAVRAAESLRRGSAQSDSYDDKTVADAIERIAPELLSEHQMLGVYMQAANDRLELVNQLERVAGERLRLIDEQIKPPQKDCKRWRPPLRGSRTKMPSWERSEHWSDEPAPTLDSPQSLGGSSPERGLKMIAEPGHGHTQTVLEGRRGMEADLLLCPRGVKHAPGLTVRLGGIPPDLTRESGCLCDQLNKIAYGNLLADAYVDRLMAFIALGCLDDRLGTVIHIKELTRGATSTPTGDARLS